MNADELGPEAAALQQAKLHIRGGKRRLRQGKIAAGIVTLYDALGSAMQWYLLLPGHRALLNISADDNLNDDKTIFDVLSRSGVLDRTFDYEAFDRVVDQALHESLSDYDYSAMLEGIESVMRQLGVMPFDESELPPEDPATF
ncbi:MAG: hypothetical protein HQL09_01030 [Nitrospirae bacterium]|nr:hypothetical protein [Nitrospirota bacterium]